MRRRTDRSDGIRTTGTAHEHHAARREQMLALASSGLFWPGGLLVRDAAAETGRRCNDCHDDYDDYDGEDGYESHEKGNVLIMEGIRYGEVFSFMLGVGWRPYTHGSEEGAGVVIGIRLYCITYDLSVLLYRI